MAATFLYFVIFLKLGIRWEAKLVRMGRVKPIELSWRITTRDRQEKLNKRIIWSPRNFASRGKLPAIFNFHFLTKFLVNLSFRIKTERAKRSEHDPISEHYSEDFRKLLKKISRVKDSGRFLEITTNGSLETTKTAKAAKQEDLFSLRRVWNNNEASEKLEINLHKVFNSAIRELSKQKISPQSFRCGRQTFCPICFSFGPICFAINCIRFHSLKKFLFLDKKIFSIYTYELVNGLLGWSQQSGFDVASSHELDWLGRKANRIVYFRS